MFGSDFVWFSYQGDECFIEWLWECLLLFRGINSSCMFVKIPQWSHWFWTVFTELYYYKFYFTFSDYYVQIIYFFLLSLGRLYVSVNLSISSKPSNLLVYKLFIVLSYDFFVFHGISCYFSSSISYFIWFLSLFFLVSLVKSLLVLFIFWKSQLLFFIDFFLSLFISLISSLIVIFFLLLSLWVFLFLVLLFLIILGGSFSCLRFFLFLGRLVLLMNFPLKIILLHHTDLVRYFHFCSSRDIFWFLVWLHYLPFGFQ